MWYVHTMEYDSAVKINELWTCYNVDEPWKPYAKWKKETSHEGPHIV